jgi:hypothetical protein
MRQTVERRRQHRQHPSNRTPQPAAVASEMGHNRTSRTTETGERKRQSHLVARNTPATGPMLRQQEVIPMGHQQPTCSLSLASSKSIFAAGLMLFVAAGPTRAVTADELKALFGRFVAAENAHGALQAESGDGAPSASIVRVAGANGHDSVGGLMPLPLWPSLATMRPPALAKSARTLGGVRHWGRLRR